MAFGMVLRKIFNSQKEILAIVLSIQKLQSDVFNKKNSFYELIAKVPNRFCKKMFKIWLQNRFLSDSKPFYLFFIFKLNL